MTVKPNCKRMWDDQGTPLFGAHVHTAQLTLIEQRTVESYILVMSRLLQFQLGNIHQNVLVLFTANHYVWWILLGSKCKTAMQCSSILSQAYIIYVWIISQFRCFTTAQVLVQPEILGTLPHILRLYTEVLSCVAYMTADKSGTDVLTCIYSSCSCNSTHLQLYYTVWYTTVEKIKWMSECFQLRSASIIPTSSRYCCHLLQLQGGTSCVKLHRDLCQDLPGKYRGLLISN